MKSNVIDSFRLQSTFAVGVGLIASAIEINRQGNGSGIWAEAWTGPFVAAGVSTVLSPVRELVAMRSAELSTPAKVACRLAYGAALAGVAAAVSYESQYMPALKPFALQLALAAMGQVAPVGYDIEHPSLLVRAQNWRHMDPIFPGQVNRFEVERARGIEAPLPGDASPNNAKFDGKLEKGQTTLDRYGFGPDPAWKKVKPTNDLETGLCPDAYPPISPPAPTYPGARPPRRWDFHKFF